MSFTFEWPESTADFAQKLELQLAEALKNGPRPDKLQGDVDLIYFSLGTRPPDLEILDIDELRNDRFRGLFKITYRGDAEIKLQTSVQMNPIPENLSPVGLTLCDHIAFANRKFVVPMKFGISDIVLSGVFLLAVDKFKGITLTFKNDPLERVDVISNFENIPAIERYIKLQMEAHVRKVLQEDLPAFIHNRTKIQNQGEDFVSKSPPSLYVDSCSTFLLHSPLTDPVEYSLGLHTSLSNPDVTDFVTGESIGTSSTHNRRHKWQNNEGADYEDLVWSEGYLLNSSLSSKFNHLNYGLKKIDQNYPISNKHVYLKKIKRDASVLVPIFKNPEELVIINVIASQRLGLGSDFSEGSFFNSEPLRINVTTPIDLITQDQKSSSSGKKLKARSRRVGDILRGCIIPGHWDNTVASDRYELERIPRLSLKMFLASILHPLEAGDTYDSSPVPSMRTSRRGGTLPAKPITIKNSQHAPLLLHLQNISRLANSIAPASPFLDNLSIKHVLLKKDAISGKGTASIARKLLLNIKSNDHKLIAPSTTKTLPARKLGNTFQHVLGSHGSNGDMSSSCDSFCRSSSLNSLFSHSAKYSHFPNPTQKVTSVSGRSNIPNSASVSKLFSTKGLYSRWLEAGYDPSTKTINLSKKKYRSKDKRRSH